MVMIKTLDPSTSFHSQLVEQTGTVALIETIFVPREKIDEFLTTWQSDASYLKAQPGFISTQLHKGTGDSQLLVNVGIWESTEALFKAFSSAEFQERAAGFTDDIIGYPHLFEKVAVEGVCVA